MEFVAADAPFANKLMIHILAAFAEHEREQISVRTISALNAAKARGVELGKNGHALAARNRREAVEFAKAIELDVRSAIDHGARKLGDIATALNEKGIQTRCGATWSVGTVQRLLQRLKVSIN